MEIFSSRRRCKKERARATVPHRPFGCMSPSQSIPVDTDFHLNVLTTMAEGMGLSPLAEEKYPRSVERGGPDEGYYIALGLVMSVWMITPLSW